jgi:hypothetical protein
MAITTPAGLTAAMAASQSVLIQKASITAAAGFWMSLWAGAGNPGAGSHDPNDVAAGIVPTAATAGAPVLTAFPGGETGYLGAVQGVSSIAGRIRIVDLLFAAGRVSLGSAATTSLTGQPSFESRLPDADYGPVEAWLVMQAANGAANTTVTISYQNQDDDAATATLDNNLNAYPVNRLMPFRLAAGDKEITRLNSITVGGATSTGYVTIYLVRKLAEVAVVAANIGEPTQDWFKLGGRRLTADSCLAAWFLSTTTSTGAISVGLEVIRG